RRYTRPPKVCMRRESWTSAQCGNSMSCVSRQYVHSGRKKPAPSVRGRALAVGARRETSAERVLETAFFGRKERTSGRGVTVQRVTLERFCYDSRKGKTSMPENSK